MPLLAVRQEPGAKEEYLSGTAFMIGDGYAITAYHVIEDFARRFDSIRAINGELQLNFQLLTVLSADSGRTRIPLRVWAAWRAEPLDLAVLWVSVSGTPPVGHRWKVPSIQLLPPMVGDPIVGFGYANSELMQRQDAPSVASLHPRASTGTVLELHHVMRDSARLNFPCFRTDARFDGGMSGGPVLNVRTKRTCGVICSSLPCSSADEPHTSYASMLWPVIATPVHDRETGDARKQVPLLHLYDLGFLVAADRDRVRVFPDNSGIYHPEAAYDASEYDRGRPSNYFSVQK